MAETGPDGSIVAFLTVDGRAVGVGMLVGEWEILTCAHVVNTALGRDRRAQDRPTEAVRVRFPLLDEPGPGTHARVEAWVPPPRDGVIGDDIAGLRLTGPPPPGTRPVRLAVTPPPPGRTVRVFGYPTTPARNGAWVRATVSGRVEGHRLQLDSGVDSALRIQPGFSGSPLFDDAAGRVVGMLAAAAPGRTAERDSYATDADRLRLAWPEAISRTFRGTKVARSTAHDDWDSLTILHVSDPQFGRNHLFGGNGLTAADRDRDSLFARLDQDLAGLAADHGLRPDLVVVTGDLAEWGMPKEFAQVTGFLAALAESAELPRSRVAIVPGNHDVNRKACEAYFTERASEDEDPVAPYWPKWKHFAAAFDKFYGDVPGATFTPDEPWSLFEIPECRVVVAGLNSTMAESHRDADHYGAVGEHQLRWFAERLRSYREQGWLRLGAVHHNAVRGAQLDDENLRDADDLDRILGGTHLINVLLHGHTHDAGLHRLPSGLIALSTGSAAVAAPARPAEVPNQYQLVTVDRTGFTRHARQYVVGQRRWVSDSRISHNGSDWRVREDRTWDRVTGTFPTTDPASDAEPDPSGRHLRGRRDEQPDGRDAWADAFLGRVLDATRARDPDAVVTPLPERGYLRVTRRLPTGGSEQWPVGVVDGPLTDAVVDTFVREIHAAFAAADPTVPSVLVYAGPLAPPDLVARARQGGVRAVTFVEYQGLLPLDPMIERQAERLTNDPAYSPGLYVPQRYRLVPARGEVRESPVQDDLLVRVTEWLGAESARLVLVLGDFGRGKTSLLRQLARTLPTELPGVLPVLIGLRGLEKAPALDGLLSQHFTNQGVEEINLRKLRYMVNSGRVALLFDGFDELELRVGYNNAAAYLQTLLTLVDDRAKVVLTSRTQHFLSIDQVRDTVRTSLGERVDGLTGSRIVVVEDFSPAQVLQFLTNLYGGDADRAAERYALLDDIEDLLGLASNPRMLGFLADLDENELRTVQRERGRISPADLYDVIVRRWLKGEAGRLRHDRGLPTLDETERLAACTQLALTLWASTTASIAPGDLAATVTVRLDRLAERGYSAEEASHAIGSGSLLVRGEDGGFGFIHQSVMEWLVAAEAARTLNDDEPPPITSVRRMSRLMVDFFADLASHEVAAAWAAGVVADAGSPQIAKQNALAVLARVPAPDLAATVVEPRRQDLRGVDLRGQDLTGRALRGADLRDAVLTSMRLEDVDLTDADLRGADLSGVRMVGGSLRGSQLGGSRWDRTALLGVDGTAELRRWPETTTAAIAELDPATPMMQGAGGTRAVAFSPDGLFIAVARGRAVEIALPLGGAVLRVLAPHKDIVTAVVFSPDGSRLATASDDGTACVWDPVTGTLNATFSGHTKGLNAVAFSPNGTELATASADHTARIWSLATGISRASLVGHTGQISDIAYSPDGTVIVTASHDSTARIWSTTTRTTRTTLAGHTALIGPAVPMTGIAFSPDGTLIVAASYDKTARIWDTTTGTTRTVLTGHKAPVSDAQFSPDGAFIVTASYDNSVRIWDATTGVTHTTLTGHTGRVHGAVFSPDGASIATASADGTARIWDRTNGISQTTLTGQTRRVNSIAFSPDGASVATASDRGTTSIWDVTTGAIRVGFDSIGPSADLLGVAFSPDGTRIATASTNGTACVRDIATGAITNPGSSRRDDQLRGIAFSPDGTRIATPSSRSTRVWDPTTGITRATLIGETRAVAFSPDGDKIATASMDRTVRIWDIATGTTLKTLAGHTGELWSVAFSSDGIRLATASADGTARIWDSATGATLRRLTGHGDELTAVTFSPDGTRLATASTDGTARIWDVTTGTALSTLVGHSASLSGVAFSPDGALLGTASTDGTARIWDAGSGTSSCVLRPLRKGRGVAVFADGSYTTTGDVGDAVWWAIKLCRFALGELDPFVPGLHNRAGPPPAIA